MLNLFSTLTRPFKIKRLKKEYKMLYGSSVMDAEQSLQRQMAYVRNKHTNRSCLWQNKNTANGKLKIQQ